MSRRTERMATEAAQQASEAGRILQAQRQPSVESVEPTPEISDRPLPPPRNEPRRMAMEEIRQREMSAKGGDPVVKQEVPAIESDTQVEEPKVEETKVEAPVETQTEPVEPVAEAPIKTIRVKVDGEEYDAPQNEVEDAGGLKSYQIQKASENRLKKAQEALAEAKQMQVAMAQFMHSQQAPQQPQISNAEFIASKMDLIRYGTPEEGSAAMAEILSRTNPAVDQNMIVNQSITQMNYQSAVKKFGAEFQDVVSNPILMTATKAMASERIQQLNPSQMVQVDWDDFYRRIGNEVRGAVGRSNQPATAPATNGATSPVSSDKEARKASIVNLPTASARAELPKESKPETREESFLRIRKSRGLPTG